MAQVQIADLGAVIETLVVVVLDPAALARGGGYLTYVNEVRIQEEEQIEMGWMEEQERASMSEIYRRYSETNGTELTVNIKNIIY